jgi:hypothetical protein
MIAGALEDSVSGMKGIRTVVENAYLSDKKSFIKGRKLVDVSVDFRNVRLVIEVVTDTTTLHKVQRLDMFCWMNHLHIIWLFCLDAKESYDALNRSVTRDIIFMGHRNIFLFDKEAQEASVSRKELVLKCNWLDESGEWHYRIGKNQTNGILVSLDQLRFNEGDCRPYYKVVDGASDDFWTLPSREQVSECLLLDQDDEEKKEDKGEEGRKKHVSVSATKLVAPYVETLTKWSEDLFIVQRDDKYGVLNRNGDVIYPVKETDKSFIIEFLQQKKWKKAVSVPVNGDSFDCVIPLENGLCKVEKDGKWGIVDPSENVIVDLVYDELASLHGQFVGIRDRKFVYLNEKYEGDVPMKGRTVLPRKGRDLVEVAGVLFQIPQWRSSRIIGEEVTVLLLSTNYDPYPKVHMIQNIPASRKELGN